MSSAPEDAWTWSDPKRTAAVRWYAACMSRIACALGLTVGLGLLPLYAQGSAPVATATGPRLLALTGRGVQVYRCDAAAGAPGWVLDHPEADLLDARGKVVGHHGAGPSWQLEDGSMVRGEAIENTASPQPGAVPWLVVRVTAHQGAGALVPVAMIRRTQTSGGVAPAQGCDTSMVGATVRVPYSASYTFYGPAEAR